nr:MAG TPA: hypothetical protein [Bacteriophage sp.]
MFISIIFQEEDLKDTHISGTWVTFTFHIPNHGNPYWLIDSNLKKKIPSQKTDMLISKIKSDMTKQRRSREGFGYYL